MAKDRPVCVWSYTEELRAIAKDRLLFYACGATASEAMTRNSPVAPMTILLLAIHFGTLPHPRQHGLISICPTTYPTHGVCWPFSLEHHASVATWTYLSMLSVIPPRASAGRPVRNITHPRAAWTHLSHKVGHDAAVIERHARPIRVEDTDDAHVGLVLAVVVHAQRLRDALACGSTQEHVCFYHA